MKKKNRNRVSGNCRDGHESKNVRIQTVKGVGGKIVSQRYKCWCCGMVMDVEPNGNLIGNPFSVKELTGQRQMETVFERVDKALS
jgi:hypothetical protein